MKALALSGGGVRGTAHVALIERIEELDLSFDLVVGTSAGAIVGALYCLYLNSDLVREELFSAVEEFLPDFTQKFAEKWGVTTVLEGFVHRSLVTLEEYYPFFRKLFGKRKFSDCKVDFIATVFNVETMETDLVNDGYLVDAVLSSSSVPGFFEQSWIGGYPVVDGGVLANVPVSIAKKLGADYVLASAFSLNLERFEDTVLDVASVEDYIRESIIQNHELSLADDAVVHDVDIPWNDFSRYLDIYEKARENLKGWKPLKYPTVKEM